MKKDQKEKVATFAGGCFWCTEAVFRKLKGVKKVMSGYTGGKLKNPTHEQVCSGVSGHTESIQIAYYPKKISYSDLLYIFFRVHDPTTKNRQGHDAGPQYRSAIFYHNERQKKSALKAKRDVLKLYKKPIVTEIRKFKAFFKAENYHQDYYKKNPKASYCTLVIDPKLVQVNKFLKSYLKRS